MEHTVSVILPVYNAGIYLEEALESIFNQTTQPFEIIAVNDGSTDDSLAVLERFSNRLRIISRENRGVSATLNQGIGMAQGSLIAFLDADDLWVSNKLEKQIAFINNNPGQEACFGMVKQFVSPELSEEIKSNIFCPSDIQKGILKLTLLIKCESFHRIGWFDESLNRGDFIDWFARAEEAKLSYSVLPELLASRRLHRSGMSSQQQHEKDLIRIAKAVMDRRRNAATQQRNG